jgi:hypothetical protein
MPERTDFKQEDSAELKMYMDQQTYLKRVPEMFE